LISVPDVVAIRKTGAPLLFTLSENCTHTESLPQKSSSALALIQILYGLPASALKVMSK
jgi:hypothetical protein